MILDAAQVRRLYARTAKFYDLALLGFRPFGIERHRRELIGALGLAKGEVALDLGCGTGANFAELVATVGPEGHVIGLDLSAAMLEKSRTRVAREGWRNVELIEADLRDVAFPRANAAVATFALEMVPGYADVIERLAEALPEGGRLGLLGLKHPETWPDWLVELGVKLTSRFGVSRDYESFRPWEAAAETMDMVELRELMFGAAYRAVAQVRERPQPNRAAPAS